MLRELMLSQTESLAELWQRREAQGWESGVRPRREGREGSVPPAAGPGQGAAGARGVPRREPRGLHTLISCPCFLPVPCQPFSPFCVLQLSFLPDRFLY